MPATSRPRRQPTDEWDQLRLLVTSPEQETYELLRPVVLFGQPAATGARETGVAARTLRRKAARFDAAGMRSLFQPDEPPVPDRRSLPLGIRKAIAELKAEYPPLGPFEIAILPLVFGLPVVAAFFSVLNAMVLWVRLREENEALAPHR